MLESVPRGVEIVLIGMLLAAAVFDMLYRRIPNWLTAGGIVAGFALNAFIRQPWPFELSRSWPGVWFSFKGFLLGFGLYFLLYLLRAMGAGDVKLMGAVGALVGAANWFGIFLVTAIIGGIMAMIVVVLKKRLKSTFWNVAFIFSEMKNARPAYVGKEELDVKNPKAVGLPHGAIIAVGTFFFLALASHFGG